MNTFDIHDESIWKPQAQASTVTHPCVQDDDEMTSLNPSREIDHEFLYGYF